jgi:DNA-binding NarL/FixJ family response regulator
MPIRVVLADDNAGFRQRLAALLRLQGDVEVAGEATDGREAIAKARELRPDVMLLDFRMTGMDGFTAARTILQENPGVKIFILTAYPGALDRAKVNGSGLQGLLIKDQPIGEIVAAIRKSVAPQASPGDD